MGLKEQRARQVADDIAAHVFHVARKLADGDEMAAEAECEALAKALAAVFVKLDTSVHK